MNFDIVVRRVGPEAADVLLDVVQRAFAAREPLDPPADALEETRDTIADALRHGGGLVATVAEEVVGVLVFDPNDDPADPVVFLRRVGVVPQAQHHGVAHALVEAALRSVGEQEPGRHVAILARQELPKTIAFWQAAGFAEVARRAPYVEMRRLARTGVETVVGRHEVPTDVAMRALGERLGRALKPGDLVLLDGPLGAGKTTLTQGIGRGLGVRGEVTSPTFVIARVHPALGPGPALVHVDAYRLGGVAELDDLDLDTSLDDAVTVVEWGEGIAEALADSWLEVRIDRSSTAGDVGNGDLEEPEEARELDPRTVTISRRTRSPR